MGDRLARRWRAAHYDEEALPGLAAESFEAMRPRDHVAMADLVRWLMTVTELPSQLDEKMGFGQPPVTVYFGGNFVIDVYFWIDCSPAIHNHPFAGAFYLLQGESLHCAYDFIEEERINSAFRLGRIERQRIELMRPGDFRLFPPAKPLIHRLLHVDQPSVSIVVRTVHLVAPQYFDYSPPTLAIDTMPRRDIGHHLRQLQMLALLRACGDDTYEALLAELLAHADVETSYRILYALYQEGRDLAVLESAFSVAECACRALCRQAARAAPIRSLPFASRPSCPTTASSTRC